MVGLYCKTSLRNSSDSKNQFTNSIELIRLLIAEEFLNSNEEARQYKILSLASFPREFCTILVVPRLYWPVWSAIMDLEEVGRLFNFKRWIDGISKTPQFIFFNISLSTSRKHRCYNYYLKRARKKWKIAQLLFLEKNFWHREMFIFLNMKDEFRSARYLYCFIVTSSIQIDEFKCSPTLKYETFHHRGSFFFLN